MFKAVLWSVLGLVVGMTSSAAHAQYFYSPYGVYAAPVVRPVFVAPVPVGVSYYSPVPVVVARPVYTSVVQSVYTAPVTYVAPAPTISYASYEPVPVAVTPVPTYVAPAPVYVAAAPVVVAQSVYAPAAYQSLRVGPFSSTYRYSSWGGPHVYARSGPFHSVVRVRGW
jgi:hypothetical protein